MLCNPKSLNAHLSYEKDYLLMDLMPQEDITCPHFDQGCPFKGTNKILDAHIQISCEYRKTRCECGFFYQVNKRVDHFKTCFYYQQCSHCTEEETWIRKGEDYQTHLKEVHDIAHCKFCGKLGDVSSIETHERECPRRIVECEICHEGIEFRIKRSHILLHINFRSERIRSLVEQLNEENARMVEANQYLFQLTEDLKD